MSALAKALDFACDDVARWSLSFRRQMTATYPLPRYGSAEWLAADTATQVAAMSVAAECWRHDELLAALRLEREIAAARREAEHQAAEEFAYLAAQVRAMANQPTHAELVARRREVA